MNPQYVPLLEKILRWAMNNDDVLNISLVGSCSRDDHYNDDYSDIDLAVITKDPLACFNNTDWLDGIDRFLFSYTQSVPDQYFYERRVLFADGLDADFIFINADVLNNKPDVLFIVKQICNNSIKPLYERPGAEVCLGNLASARKTCSHPSEAEFMTTVNNFYFHVIWALKKTGRGELWIATACSNNYMKPLLLKMIEWYEHLKNGTDYETYYNGRHIEEWADKEKVLPCLKNIFCSSDPADIRKSVIESFHLFHDLAQDVAAGLKYQYPEQKVKELNSLTEKY